MKIKTAIISLLFVSFFVFTLSPVEGFAQNGALPNAGITPENPFYFLDKLGEALREFFTFSPEGKAHLQITFASERIAEIKVILETKGVKAPGLEVAQARLQAHLANAATIITAEKAKGRDVSKLAKELDDDFDEPKSALEDTFKAEKRLLETKEKELKVKIREARQAGDNAQVEALIKELAEIKAQKELLELKEEEQEEALEQEEEKIEREVEKKEEAQKAIKEAEEEKQEVLDGAAEEGVSLPADAFEKFDRLLSQAKELFEKENYVGAKQLAKQAEKSLEKVEEAVVDLDEAKEKEEGLKEAEEERQQKETEGQNKEEE